ncbi:MAG: DUF4197 domain-containing protein [Flavobacteriales bacterium]|nr:DUF4197 domain-containing protein [Flavobacteriales bacterium]MCB9168233.1 DUF4197 domain-containing protein [Flavobacteriales bacterium]
MKTQTLFAISALLLSSCSSSQDLQGILNTAGQVLNSGASGNGLSNDDVVAGLKQALEVGTRRAVDQGGAEDGFWNNAAIRIPFPPEAIKVKNTLTDLGIKKPVEDFEHTLNNAAETAVLEAVPIFVDAITGMSIQDGSNILNGGEHAATEFLRQRTTEALVAKFGPTVREATRKVALTSYWTPVANAYNTATLLTGGGTVDPDLDAYVTNKAIDGLFTLLADEERKIREDPLARTTELLQRVFGRTQ